MRIFSQFDRDMDGTIDLDELTDACTEFLYVVRSNTITITSYGFVK